MTAAWLEVAVFSYRVAMPRNLTRMRQYPALTCPVTAFRNTLQYTGSASNVARLRTKRRLAPAAVERDWPPVRA